MKECKIFHTYKQSRRIKMLSSEDAGLLMCWRDGNRKCSSDCVAWRESSKKIQCMALPKGKNSTTIIAVLKKEKKQ